MILTNDPEKIGKPELIDEIGSDGVALIQTATSGTSTMMMSAPAYYFSRNMDDLHLDKSNFESIMSVLLNFLF